MALEWFARLKEYDSLNRMKEGCLRTIQEQEARLASLQQRRDESMAQMAKHKQDAAALQEELSATEAKLRTSTEQRQRLVDHGGSEEKIREFAHQIAHAEDAGLALLERIEEVSAAVAEIETFLRGLEKTRQEIAQEVAQTQSLEEEKRGQLEARLTGIMEELPSEFRALLQKVQAKNLAHGPFTRIEQGSCFFCRYKISRVDESEVDMQKKLKTCPQCGRIFIPFGT